MMNKNSYNFFFVIGLITLWFGHTYAQPNVIDGIDAIVGGNIITKSSAQARFLQYQEQNPSGTASNCKVFEELLYQKLLLTQAQLDSLTVSDAQVESELERRMRFFIYQFGSEEKFEAFYGKTISQFKEELREDVKELLLSQTMQQKITGGVTVTPSEVRDYFNSIPADSVPFINAEVEVGQIVKKPHVSAEAKREAKEKIEGIRQRVLKGENFAALAALYSEDPGSARKGGCYDSIRRGQFVPEFDAVAFSVKEDEISDVFETNYGFHFLKVKQRRGDVVDVCHLLITPKSSPDDMERAKRLLDSVAALINRDSISFTDAAGKYSDDEDSKNNGGRLMNPQTGASRFSMDEISQIDPALVFTINKLKTGELTAPQPTMTRDAKQAYRLICVILRTEPHKANMKDDYQRLQAVALAQKQQKAVAAWVKKKVGTVYIKVSDEYKGCSFEHPWVKNN